MIEIIPNWHPILVHFTIALLSTSVGLFLLAALLKTHRWREQWLSVANWNLWIGAGFAILTALAGWDAYNTVAHDTPSHAAMTDHRNWALATLAIFLVLAAWSIVRHRAKKLPDLPFLIIAVIAGGLLMSTGWHGAEAVYRYGLGVMSLPQVEGEGHAHEHADGEGHDEMASEMHEEDSHGQDGNEVEDQHGTNSTMSTMDDHHDDATAEPHGHDDVMSGEHGNAGAEQEDGKMHTHEDGSVDRH